MTATVAVARRGSTARRDRSLDLRPASGIDGKPITLAPVITGIRQRRAAAATLVATLMLLSACGSSSAPAASPGAPARADSGESASAQTGPTPSDADQGTTPAVASESAAPVAGETRDEILRLARTQVDGVGFDPDTVAGRDVLLWFWAPW